MSRVNRRGQLPPADFDRPGTLEPLLCHAVSRCLRGIHLLRENAEGGTRGCPRQARSVRLAALCLGYAVEPVGHAFVENHFHVLLRADPQVAACWTPREVVERWLVVHPDRGLSRKTPVEREAADCATSGL